MEISRHQIMAQGVQISQAASFGSVLRQRRKKFGYTQEDIADALGFSPRLIGEIERGRGTVGFDKILAYATTLGIDLVAFER